MRVVNVALLRGNADWRPYLIGLAKSAIDTFEIAIEVKRLSPHR